MSIKNKKNSPIRLVVRLLLELVYSFYSVIVSKTTSRFTSKTTYTSSLKKQNKNVKVKAFLKNNNDSTFIDAIDETLDIHPLTNDYYEVTL